MKLKFLGGASGVTGSKTLLTVGKEQYLIDYGLFQGSAERREGNWEHFHHASKVSAVFLTHAHIDHSGLLPRLWKDGFRGDIYCSRETFKLCQILLEDSARIHQEDSEYANKKKYSRHKPALPLYTQDEVEEVLKKFKTVNFEEEVKISDKVSITFFWAGHIMGASFIQVKCANEEGEVKKIVFSGDVGHKRNILLKPPRKMCETDFLVLESTYGNKLHPRIPAKEVLGMYLKMIINRGGTAVIPSFSVGRTQDVLYLVKELIEDKMIPEVPVILDSPLSKKANKIFNQCFKKEFIRDDVLEDASIYPKSLIEIQTSLESKKIAGQTTPMIIISASGMIDGGRVVHHVKKRVINPKNGIILVGFQPEGTKGRLLIDGIKMLRLHKQEFPVEASIFYVNSLSAHADYLDMVEWLKESNIDPQLVILNHGEEQGSKHFKVILESELNYNATVADYGEEFELNHIWSRKE